MKITDIKVFPVREDKLKAFVSIILDDCFMVNDIKVIRGKDGYFISMPSRRKRSGKFKDIAHPLNNETRQEMEKEILAAYEATPVPAEREAAAGDRQGSDEGRPEKRPRRRRRRRRGPKRPAAASQGDAGQPPAGADAPSERRPRPERAAAGGVGAAGGVEPQQPSEPSQPAKPTQPAEPGHSVEPAATTESAERSRPREPSEPAPATAAGSQDSSDSGPKGGEAEAQSAEEVAEKHLSDSFWGT